MFIWERITGLILPMWMTNSGGKDNSSAFNFP